jgi:hypothetical protein
MESTATTPASQDTLWTARVQHLSSTTRPVKLIELGAGPRGKFARIEFEDEVTRPIYLPLLADACCPLFDSLTSRERLAIYKHFNPHTPEVLPDGNVKRRQSPSFNSRTETKHGKHLGFNSFDVEPATHDDGFVEGLRLAKEYLAALSVSNFHIVTFREIVSGMASAIIEADGVKLEGDTPIRGNVVSGFLVALEEMLKYAAKNCNHQKYYQEQIDHHHVISALFKKTREESAQKKNAAFIERMREAKDAKRQASALA